MSKTSISTKKKEEKAAKQFNARRQPRSGASPFTGEKEDLVSDEFLFQHKEAKGKTHTIKKMDLTELKRNAIDMDKTPAYIIDFDSDIWVLISKNEFDMKCL